MIAGMCAKDALDNTTLVIDIRVAFTSETQQFQKHRQRTEAREVG